MTRRAETFMLFNTLSSAVELSRGKVTTVELRNECYVTGRIAEVDGYMNICMEGAVFTDPRGLKRNFDSFFVPCRLIRYVQVPPEVDIVEGMKKLFEGKGKPDRAQQIPISGSRKKILELRRKRQQEDLANALAMKKKGD